jgi:hypothetical protein
LIAVLISLAAFMPAFSQADSHCLQLAQSLLSSSNSLPTRTRFIADTLSKSANAREAITHFYGPKASPLIAEFASLGEDYVPLAMHPGILSRTKEFMDFAHSMGQLPTPTELLKRFSDHLGTTTVYRGLAVTEEDVAKARQVGLLATPFRTYRTLESPMGDSTFEMMVAARLTERNSSQNFLMSVTRFPDIARDISTKYVSDPTRQRIRIFSITIPKIDLIELSTDETSPFCWPGTFLGAARGEHPFNFNGKNYAFGADVESFIAFKIEPGEITSISQ